MIAFVEDPVAFVRGKGLGWDALDTALSVHRLQKLFGGRRTRVKGALLNQRFIAGIGNIYADEILFQARLHPEAPVGRLRSDALRGLLKAMRSVLRTAICAKADPERMPRSWLLPHRTPTGSCPRCRKRVRRMTLVGRTCYFCGACQRRQRRDMRRPGLL